MAPRFTAINLSGMDAPDVVERLDYEQILAEMKALAVAKLAAEGIAYDVDALESDPAVKVLEVAAYRELVLRARVNTAARAVMLAYASGRDLEHLGAYFGVKRMVVTPAANGNPVVMEDDERLRERIQLAPEALSTCGPVGAYRFHAMTVDGAIKHVGVLKPAPGEVHVLPLTIHGDGTPPLDLLQRIRLRLLDDTLRPLTDVVTVRAPGKVAYTVEVALDVAYGPDPGIVRAAAEARVRAYVAERHRVGLVVALAGIIAAAKVAGVDNVHVASPPADVAPAADQFAHAAAVTVSLRQ
jgi:phage-related baseplate assembly protein